MTFYILPNFFQILIAQFTANPTTDARVERIETRGEIKPSRNVFREKLNYCVHLLKKNVFFEIDLLRFLTDLKKKFACAGILLLGILLFSLKKLDRKS